MDNYNQIYLAKIKEIILSIIDTKEYKVFLFGSRATKKFKRYSDVDIGLLGNKPVGNAYYKIINKIEESDIPYKVDIEDFALVDEQFKKIALEEIEIWSDPKYS
ncbi:MAG: nucleotidyltransferase domain-containing protein [Ignavibacterium sp.]|nr:nucleotidyltransferase domain-containing protein [Ignavibacterium sp.]